MSIKHERAPIDGFADPDMMGLWPTRRVSREELVEMFSPRAAKLCMVFSPTYRHSCELAEGHDGDHRDDRWTWGQGEEGPET